MGGGSDTPNAATSCYVEERYCNCPRIQSAESNLVFAQKPSLVGEGSTVLQVRFWTNVLLSDRSIRVQSLDECGSGCEFILPLEKGHGLLREFIVPNNIDCLSARLPKRARSSSTDNAFRHQFFQCAHVQTIDQQHPSSSHELSPRTGLPKNAIVSSRSGKETAPHDDDCSESAYTVSIIQASKQAHDHKPGIQ